MDTLGLVLRVVCSLGAVLGLVWMVRRGMLRSGGGRARAAVGSITVLARQQLTSRASVALVQVGGTGLVLGVTDSSVQVLASRPVDELLLQPAEPLTPARPAPALAGRPVGRRLLPGARREAVVLPELLLAGAAAPEQAPTDAASSREVGPEPAVVVPAVLERPAAAPLAVTPLPAPQAPAAPVLPAAPPEEPLYEELRRRAASAVPRQERREMPLPQPAAPAAEPAGEPVLDFGALLDREVEEPAAARPAAAEPDVAPAPAPRARHARTRGAGSPAGRGGARGGALTGSALSPATWAQAVDALRERAGQR